MSSLIVEVCEVSDVQEHGNADALEIAVVKGWRCVVQKGKFQPGDTVVYFPVDTVLPLDLSDRLGVTKYLSKGRLRAAKLRGIISCGLVSEPDDTSWPVGQNVADHYGVTKWEPPEVHGAGDAERDHALFLKYTDIENVRNFPDVLREGEYVWITEKIHGTNCRLGRIEGVRMAGSHNQRRKEPEDLSNSLYWMPWTLESVQEFFPDDPESPNAILYGEVYGDGVQDLKYGHQKGHKEFRAFDIFVDDKFMDYHHFTVFCEGYGIPMVPTIYKGSWKPALLELANGRSEIAPDQMREGIVIRPGAERWDDTVGRVILKCISDEYLVRRGGKERH